MQCSSFLLVGRMGSVSADWHVVWLVQVLEGIRDMFVTGKWAEDEDAEALLDGEGPGDGEDGSDEELYGDFEDLETGEKHKADENKEGMCP